MDTQTQFLKPEEIAQKFDITEHEVWRKLESGEWQAQTLCEQTGIEGGHLPFDRACINAEVVRLLIGKPGQEVEFTTRYGHRRKASAGKENIEVLVGPEFTPELFSLNHSEAVQKNAPSEHKSLLTTPVIAAIDWPIPKGGPKDFNALLSDTPKWLEEARVFRGTPGKSPSLWNPVMLAICLASRSKGKRWHSNKAALDKLFKNHLPEFDDEWKARSEMI